MIDLRTLGALDLRRRDGPELQSVLAQAKRTALLVYLALARPHGFHRRDTLTGLFWPEHDTEHARNNLRQAVHFLRRSLGEEAIVSRGDEDIGLADGILSCDAVQLEAALDAGEVARGLSLYAGDLLPGFFVEEAPAFERWLEGERTRLRERAVRGCWSLAEVKERAGDTATAAEWGRRAVEIAPADDTQIMRLMQLLARGGDRSEALAAFEAYARRLRTELEVEPTEAAAALAEEIRKAQPVQPERVEAPAAAMAAVGTVEMEAAKSLERAPAQATGGEPIRLAGAGAGGPAPPPGPDEPEGDEARFRRTAKAPAAWLPGIAGISVGIPVAVLAVGLGHALRPVSVPLVPVGVLMGATGLVLLEAALLALRVTRRWTAQLAVRPAGRVGAGAGFGLGVLVALSLAYTLAPSAPPHPRLPPSGAALVDTVKRKVAVTRFANLTGDPALDPVGRLAEDWVVRRLRLMPEAVVVATALAAPADTSLDAVTGLARRTGADLVLFGRYYREGDDVLLAAWLVPPRGGRIPPEITGLAIGPVRAPRDRPVGGVDRLASLVAGAVAGGCRLPPCVPGRRAPMYEARQLYVESYQAADIGDWEIARRKLRQAIALDSTFASGYTHLAEMSNCAQKDSIGSILEARRQEFGLHDLLYMRVVRARCHGDFEALYRFRRQQFELAPTLTQSRADLADGAMASGRLREAEAQLRLVVGQIRWYYGMFCVVLHLEGKLTEELAVAARGRRERSQDPRSASFGLRGLAALGRMQEIEARVEEARRAGIDLVQLASMYHTAMLEADWHGRPDVARQLALAGLRELDRSGPTERRDLVWGSNLRMRSEMLLELGRWEEARRLADGGDRSDPLRIRVRGLAAAGAGDVSVARAAVAALHRLPDSAFGGEPGSYYAEPDTREYSEASVLAALGDRDEALRRLEDGQARRSLPRSTPFITHADAFLLRALWHDRRFERMFAARD